MEGTVRLSEIGQGTTSSAALASDDTETVIGVSYGIDGGDPGVYNLHTTKQSDCSLVHHEMLVSLHLCTRGSVWTVVQAIACA